MSQQSDSLPPRRAGIVGRRFRALRRAAGKSQIEMGRIMGLSQSGISEIEQGTRQLPADQIDQLARYFNVSPAAFFEEPVTVNRTSFSLKRVDKESTSSYTQSEAATPGGLFAASLADVQWEMASKLSEEDFRSTYKVLDLMEQILRRRPEPPPDESEETA